MVPVITKNDANAVVPEEQDLAQQMLRGKTSIYKSDYTQFHKDIEESLKIKAPETEKKKPILRGFTKVNALLEEFEEDSEDDQAYKPDQSQ